MDEWIVAFHPSHLCASTFRIRLQVRIRGLDTPIRGVGSHNFCWRLLIYLLTMYAVEVNEITAELRLGPGGGINS